MLSSMDKPRSVWPLVGALVVIGALIWMLWAQ